MSSTRYAFEFGTHCGSNKKGTSPAATIWEPAHYTDRAKISTPTQHPHTHHPVFSIDAEAPPMAAGEARAEAN